MRRRRRRRRSRNCRHQMKPPPPPRPPTKRKKSLACLRCTGQYSKISPPEHLADDPPPQNQTGHFTRAVSRGRGKPSWTSGAANGWRTQISSRRCLRVCRNQLLTGLWPFGDGHRRKLWRFPSRHPNQGFMDMIQKVVRLQSFWGRYNPPADTGRKKNDHSFRILEMQAKSTRCDKFCTSYARAGLHLQTTSQPTLLTVSEPGSYTRVYALHVPYIASTRIVTTCQKTTARLSSTVLLYTEKLITSCTITNTHNDPSFRHDLPHVPPPPLLNVLLFFFFPTAETNSTCICRGRQEGPGRQPWRAGGLHGVLGMLYVVVRTPTPMYTYLGTVHTPYPTIKRVPARTAQSLSEAGTSSSRYLLRTPARTHTHKVPTYLRCIMICTLTAMARYRNAQLTHSFDRAVCPQYPPEVMHDFMHPLGSMSQVVDVVVCHSGGVSPARLKLGLLKVPSFTPARGKAVTYRYMYLLLLLAWTFLASLTNRFGGSLS